MVDHSLKGKTVLIAGGAKNLGGLIARDLAEHGAKAVAVHYNSAASKAEADATVAAVQAAGQAVPEVLHALYLLLQAMHSGWEAEQRDLQAFLNFYSISHIVNNK